MKEATWAAIEAVTEEWGYQLRCGSDHIEFYDPASLAKHYSAHLGYRGSIYRRAGNPANQDLRPWGRSRAAVHWEIPAPMLDTIRRILASEEEG